MEKIVLGVVIHETEISDKEVAGVMGSTTLVKTSPVLGMEGRGVSKGEGEEVLFLFIHSFIHI